MADDNECIKSPSTAREYIKRLAVCFDDPQDLADFLGMCDVMQALCAKLVIKEINYENASNTECLMEDDVTYEIQPNAEKAYNEYKHALDDLDRALKKMKLIIVKNVSPLNSLKGCRDENEKHTPRR